MIRLVNVLQEVYAEQQLIKEVEARLGRKLTEAEIQEVDWKTLAATATIGASSVLPLRAAGQDIKGVDRGKPTVSAPTSTNAFLPHVEKVGQKAQKDGYYDGFPGRYTTEMFAPGNLQPVGAGGDLKRVGDAPTPGSTKGVTLQSLGSKFTSDWNTYRDWAANTSVDDINGNGDKSPLLDLKKAEGQRGNPILDKDDFRALMVAKFEKEHPNSIALKEDNIKKFQEAMVNHRNGILQSKASKTVNLKLK